MATVTVDLDSSDPRAELSKCLRIVTYLRLVVEQAELNDAGLRNARNVELAGDIQSARAVVGGGR